MGYTLNIEIKIDLDKMIIGIGNMVGSGDGGGGVASAITQRSGYVDFAAADLNMSSVSGVDTELYDAPRLIYNSGKTYFAYQSKYDVLPFGQAKLLVFDEDAGFDRPVNVSIVPPITDTHNIPAIAIDNNIIYIVQEHTHDTPIKVYKSDTSLDYGSFTQPFNIGTELSYPHLVKNADGNWAMWSRGIAAPTANYYSIHATKASAGFETWGGQVRITSRPTGEDPLLRHYPGMPFGRYRADGFIHLLINYRKDDGVSGGSVWFHKYYYLKTPDSGADFMNVFYNETETFFHTISIDGILSDAILATNFSYHQTNNNTTSGFTPCVGLGSNGNAYRIVGNAGRTGFSFIYYDAGVKVEKAVNINDLSTSASQLVTQLPFSYMMVHSDDNIEVVVYQLLGGLVRPHLFKTRDKGDTWIDLGDMCPEVSDRNLRVQLPNNIFDIPADSNFPIYYTYFGVGIQKGTIGKVAALGTVQTMAGDSVTGAEPPTTNGLFRYRCQSANMTRSGNNVTQLNDIFGIRNAPCNANPQWNGSNQVTFLSSSLQKFTPATPSTLVNQTALTFFFVGKNVSGIVQYMLSFTHSTDDEARMSFNLTTAGKAEVYYDEGFSIGNVLVTSQDNIDDGNLHLVTIVLDGVKRTDIYIDGKLQYGQPSGATTLAEWQNIGVGPADLNSKNIVVGASQNRGTDFYADLILAEERLYSGAMRLSDLRPAMKKLCDDYGITFRSQYQLPA